VLGRGDLRVASLGLFTLAALVLGALVQRFVVLFAIAAPPLAAAAAAALPRHLGRALAASAGLVHVVLAVLELDDYRLGWYDPPELRRELRALVERVPHLVPEGEAIAGDFVNSPALLAHTRRPICVQPKWEAGEGLARSAALLTTFAHGSADDLRRLCVEQWRARHLLVDRHVMWGQGRWAAGVPLTQLYPTPGTAAALLCSDDPRVLAGIPGYQPLLVTHRYRLFRLR
jgi:hypothetical protein